MTIISEITPLSEERARVIANFKANVDSSLRPELQHSVVGVLTTLIAGAKYSNSLLTQRSAQAIFFSSAIGEALDSLVAFFNIQRRAATPAVGTVRMTFPTPVGLNTLGNSWTLTFADTDNNQYIASGNVLNVSGTDIPFNDVRTSVLGDSANIGAGVALTLASSSFPDLAADRVTALQTVLATASSITTSTDFTGGVEGESDDQLQRRFGSVLKTPTAAGTEPEFINWTSEVSGVTRVFARSLSPGTVNIYPVFDTQTQGLPTKTQRDEIEVHLQRYKPLPIELRVLPFTPRVININVTINPQTVALESATRNAITDSFIAYNGLGDNFVIQRVWQALATVPGLTGSEPFNIISPTSNVEIGPQEIAIPNITIVSAS